MDFKRYVFDEIWQMPGDSDTDWWISDQEEELIRLLSDSKENLNSDSGLQTDITQCLISTAWLIISVFVSWSSKEENHSHQSLTIKKIKQHNLVKKFIKLVWFNINFLFARLSFHIYVIYYFFQFSIPTLFL